MTQLPGINESGWTEQEIESAYQKALEAYEGAPPQDSESAALPTGTALSASVIFARSTDLEVRSPDLLPVENPANTPSVTNAPAGTGEARPRNPDLGFETSSPRISRDLGKPSSRTAASPEAIPPRGLKDDQSQTPGAWESSITPLQVIEAALFVGGPPLSSGKLFALLRGSIPQEQVVESIDQLNSLYTAQQRPYEIRLGDGGYRLQLRPEYDRLKARVFGQGPREVKLAQETLEILALVAFRQPISQPGIESLGPTGVGNQLRQLLRRDLIQIERKGEGAREVLYRTTPRFLTVFGLGSLLDLPEPEDLAAR